MRNELEGFTCLRFEMFTVAQDVTMKVNLDHVLIMYNSEELTTLHVDISNSYINSASSLAKLHNGRSYCIVSKHAEVPRSG